MFESIKNFFQKLTNPKAESTSVVKDEDRELLMSAFGTKHGHQD